MYFNHIRRLPMGVAALALAACGGGGTSNGSGSFGSLSASQIEDRGASLLRDFAFQDPTVEMPASGSATFVGVGASSNFNGTPQQILDTADSVFEVRADVDFGSGAFTGEVGNVQSLIPGVSFSGSLDVDGTVSGNGFDGSYTGTLTQSGTAVGRSLDVTYAGTINGVFVGDDAAAMVGIGQGTLQAVGVPGSLRNYTYWGAAQ